MRFLITGGAGRLGSELVRLIAERGDEALAFDVPQASWDAVRGIRGIEIIQGDVTGPDQVAEACRDVDGVFHLAAILPPRSEADRDLAMRVNFEGTRSIVRALERRPDTPLVFASSVSTYGITAREEPPIHEDHPLRAHDNYSESKIEAEGLIRGSGVQHAILRIAPISVAEIVELPETIPYRADQRVEFLYIADAARALLSAMERPEAIERTYNIAGGPSWQMTGAEYIERFYDALGVDVKPNFSEAYTGADWYDTSQSRILGYQRTTFNRLLDRLRVLGEELGLR
jgi:nucleoside-diphosphate-sugar epimerase